MDPFRDGGAIGRVGQQQPVSVCYQRVLPILKGQRFMSTEQSNDPRIGACAYLLHGLLQRLDQQQPGLIAGMTDGIRGDRAAMDPESSASAAHGCQVADEALGMLQRMSAQMAQAAAPAPRASQHTVGCVQPTPDVHHMPPMHELSAQFPDAIETLRLRLRAPELSDAQDMFAAYTQDAEVARYMVWHPHASLDDTREFAASCVAQWRAGLARSYVITSAASGRFVGMLEARPRGHIVNIGYLLARNHWGQGLMVEAIQAFAAIALQLPGIFRVEATCDVENRPSARALEKSGFLLEGRLSRYTVHPNISAEPRDCLIYAVCRP